MKNNRIIFLNDKRSTVVNINNIKRVCIGDNYPFLSCFDLKIDDLTISYNTIEDRALDFFKLTNAMEKEL